MKPTIIKRPRAKRDLIEQAAYIAQDSPRAADRFLQAAEDAFAQLAEMPGMGRRWSLSVPGFEDVRVWPITRFRNYLIFYRPIDDGIEVLHVFHGARDIPAILRQEADE